MQAHAFEAPLARSNHRRKYNPFNDISQISPTSIAHDAPALGGFVVEAISTVPAGARLQPGSTKVSWLDVECGRWAQLEGATELYAESTRRVTALVTQEARLHLFDGEGCIVISAGLWRISPPE